MLNNKNVNAVFDPENQEWRARAIADSQFKCHCGSTVAEVIELTISIKESPTLQFWDEFYPIEINS